ncbi:MAG: tetratricopeptide repeat protein [Deltaproteobacteria bacterium]|nr:tetratricopeptide repeat protein [Deltaproteobacteria bacterium]
MAGSKRPAQPLPGVMGGLQSEVSVEAAPLLQFMIKHIGVIVGIVLFLIVGIVATGAYQWHSSRSLHEARMALGKILTGGTTGADRVKALEALVQDVPASMRIGLWLEVAAAAQEAQDYAQAAVAFGRVGQLDKSPLGFVSLMNQADMLLRTGDAAKALDVLEPLVTSAPETMRLTVRESVAGAAEAAGDTQKAIAMYQSMLAAGQSQDIAYYRARITALEKK